MMDKAYFYATLGGLIGIIVGILLAGNAVNNRNYGMMSMMGMRMMQREQIDYSMQIDEDDDGMNMSMSQMSSLLATLENDEFDREFLVRMIDHHKGAVDMAELVLEKSDRPELKNLADEIITAQTKEIKLMEDWLEDWSGGGE